MPPKVQIREHGRGHVRPKVVTCRHSVCLVLPFISMRASFGVKVSLGVIGVSVIFAVLKMSQLLDKAKTYVADKVANMPKPEATVADVDFQKVSRDSVQYLAKVSVSNPYATPLPICEIKYSLKSADRFLHSSFFHLSLTVNHAGSILQDLLLLFLLFKFEQQNQDL